MINILLEGFDIDAPWLYGELKNYIKPNQSVAVVAFSFRDNRVKSLSDWDALYGKVNGKYHDGIVGGFTAYGIPADKITFINYFTDTKETAAQKIKEADSTVVTSANKDFLLDIVGRYTVTIGGKSYDTVCVMDIETYDCGVVSEQFLDKNGKTILWRRFNRDDWAIDRYKKPWSEQLPENDRLTVNGTTYVHWYDCITDYIL